MQTHIPECLAFGSPQGYFNGEANNFKMELFKDIYECSGGCWCKV